MAGGRTTWTTWGRKAPDDGWPAFLLQTKMRGDLTDVSLPARGLSTNTNGSIQTSRGTRERHPELAPSTMRALRSFGEKDIRVVDVDEPTPSDDKIIVEVDWCGICGSDLHLFHMGMCCCYALILLRIWFAKARLPGYSSTSTLRKRYYHMPF